ncbi:hypothetical protein CASFOL_012062 [Castilleja foliolosa]|uniref:HRDC domain-containing protein n=1 Tax=Castilleja foliolosa TaxID=1961234 RepID=A0ABD3DPA3_9LAMI
MEIDQSEDEIDRRSDVLRNLSSKGPLPTSIAKLSGSSRIIPSQKDFHFYNNFQEFKHPVQEFDRKSKNLLEKIGASENLFGKSIPLPDDKDVELDDDVALDWLVNVNDEIFERFDVSLDDFKRLRKGEEESGVRTMRVNGKEENGFQMVYGKKNRKPVAGVGRNVDVEMKGVQEVKVAAKLKPKIPFHVPTITKPQEEYKIIVNNSNQPFEHVWLQKSEDGSRFLHPLEQLSVLDFVDESDSITEPEKPLPIEVTPLTLVKDVKDLKQLAVKLRNVNEFAVDLEHNQYRSFQGLTCLMQISTRTEDFIIDTLKLRVHIGPYLREVFKDPTKRKVLHGADRDIVWLQRDFGIYICNMFDTGQASRVLKMERYSLEHLLSHFCGVTANKEYQNADWRIRPLPHEMIKYGREDTHYLLYIYDLMRIRLLSLPADPEGSDPPLIEVYKRSYNICTQLYEKELLTETSYLHIYGVQSAGLNAKQLAVVSGLYEWRDVVARAEDESTGYVLPNRTLIEIAKQLPLTQIQLRHVLKSKLPYIERNLASVVSMIRHSVQNAAAFEEAAKLLKEKRLEIEANNALAAEEAEALLSDAPDEILKNAEEIDDMQSSTSPKDLVNVSSASKVDVHGDPNPSSSRPAEATVQLLKKPSRGFGALFGNSAKRKFNPHKAEDGDTKLEQIKSTVSLPFHSFSGSDERLQTSVEDSPKKLEISHPASAPPATGSTLEDIIVLDDDDSDIEDSKGNSDSTPNGDLKQVENNEMSSGSDADEPMSLSDLSSSFEKCLPSTAGAKVTADESLLQVKPFDYETARKEVKFGQNRGGEPMEEGDGGNRRKDRKKGLMTKDNKSGKNEESADFGQGKRRQAFPASGNRSATFR